MNLQHMARTTETSCTSTAVIQLVGANCDLSVKTMHLFVSPPAWLRRGAPPRKLNRCAQCPTRMSVAGGRLRNEELQVAAASRTYPISFKDGGLGDPDCYAPYLSGDKALVVTNDTIAPLYLATVEQALRKAGVTVVTKILPDGEQYKSVECLSTVWDACMDARLDRKSTILALGGGVIGDITGFAAASFVRGIPFIQIPTTLLAVVDSAVGGKTAVNHPSGKNMIGAFYQPRAVVVDADVLSTLDDRQLAAGVAEVIKYGIIRDWDFFEWCESNVDRLVAREPDALRTAMVQSCRHKAAIVSEDEREGGVRAILNLGHTFGHAIEASMGYGSWLHGEAVAAGMVMACVMSAKMGLIGDDVTERVVDVLARAGLPTKPPPSVTLQQYMTYMSVDKKVESGKLRLVLVKKPGEAFVTGDFDEEILFDTIMHFHQLYKKSPGTYEHSLGKLTL